MSINKESFKPKEFWLPLNQRESKKQIIIDNSKMDFDLGCQILKMKYKECPFPDIESFWDDIVPISFKEISKISNLEIRRIAIKYYGLENIVKEVKPKLICKNSLTKNLTWITEKGEIESFSINDTYELYEVDKKYFTEGIENRWEAERVDNVYYVKCKDTSTDREYLIWVDIDSIRQTNRPNKDVRLSELPVNAIQAVAWTIQTNIPKGKIEKIIRQGDCVLIKPTRNAKPDSVRHLTEKEYRELLVAES